MPRDHLETLARSGRVWAQVVVTCGDLRWRPIFTLSPAGRRTLPWIVRVGVA